MGLFHGTIAGQGTPVAGIVNDYAKIVSVDAADRVTLDDASAFSPGDTVLVIQMKGLTIDGSNSSSFGNRQSNGGVGKYEFIRILSKSGNQVIFTNNLQNFGSYDATGSLQLVRVPGYFKAEVTAPVTCKPWDGNSGGVVALFVGNTLTLSADIDVAGKGFIGGPAAQGDEQCSTTDPPGYDDYFYDAASLRAGNKGEGIASTIFLVGPVGPAYQKGRGKMYNGGGGGNAKYSGAGGGANYGAGGLGGVETCSANDLSGIPGKGLVSGDINYLADRRLVMGGGGGSSTYGATGVPVAGGNAGGLVILVADSLVGNGHSILAGGQSVSTQANAQSGGGGGGAGGTVALEVRKYHTSNLFIDVSGGNGGNTNSNLTDCTGPGGGGGGGLVWHKGVSLPANVNSNINLSGGIGGLDINCGINPGGNGGAGFRASALDLVITGFLFNTIKLYTTNDLTDTICEGTIPSKILGSSPKGGTTPYSYTWQISLDSLVWNDIAGANSMDYAPPAPLADTTWYRRIVKDISVPQIVDISKPVQVNVHPALADFSISFEDTVCFNQVPPVLQPDNPVPSGGDGIYTYRWEESTDNVNFTDASGTFTNATYAPPALTQTSYYRRWVYSGKCFEVSDTVRITVLPSITNNSISADQVICEGSGFALLDGLTPSNGDGTYRYVWEESVDGTNFVNAFGAVTDQEDYQPDAPGDPNFPSQSARFFRRVVFSGSDDVCQDISNQVSLTQWPAIANNSFTTDQVLCEGAIPADVIAPDATGGEPANYLYQWQDSIPGGSWQDISGQLNRDLSFSSPVTDSLFIRRVVQSDVCMDTSPLDTISVHPALQNTDIQTPSGLTDTTICSGQVPNPIVPEPAGISGGDGIYIYTWEESTDGGSSWNPVGGDTPDLTPGALTQTTVYRRTVTSGQCSEMSAHEVTINVLPLINGNTIPLPAAICSGTSTTLNAPEPGGGAGTGSYTYYWEESPDNASWSAAQGTNTGQTYSTPALATPTWYRRTVTSGPSACCQDISPAVFVDIHPLPTSVITDPALSVCSGTAVNIPVNLTGTQPWSVIMTDGTNNYSQTGLVTSTYQHPVTPSTGIESQALVYTISSVTDGNGCQADVAGMTGQGNVTVYGPSVADAGPDDAVCGLDYTLQAALPYGTGIWTFPAAVTDITDNGNPAKQVSMSDEGTYVFTWTVINGPCPADADDVSLTFWKPVSAATMPPDTTTEPYATQVELTATPVLPVVGTFLWSADPQTGIQFSPDNAATTLVTNLGVGEQIITFTITNGLCEDSYNVAIIVPSYEAGSRGLTPNGDGKNDYFRIFLPKDRSNELVVFNRWGNVVYKEKDFMLDDNTGWDGRDLNGEPLPNDTYYYVIKIEGGSTRSGFIVIRGVNQ